MKSDTPRFTAEAAAAIRALHRLLLQGTPGKLSVLLAKLHGENIAFGLVLDSGASSYYTHCGLDYERTIPAKVYFNLYYALIEHAILQKKQTVELGTQAYMVKQKLGHSISSFHWGLRSFGKACKGQNQPARFKRKFANEIQSRSLRMCSTLSLTNVRRTIFIVPSP